MKRFFGGSKPQTPAPSLDDISKTMDARGQGLDQKIARLDKELMGFKEQMKKTKEGTSAHNMLKQRALKVLKQKKMYEQQRDQIMAQSFNIDQANFTQQTMKDTVVTVDAMKGANVAMKAQMKNFKIEDIDNLQDDMADIMDMNNEIQEALGRTYDVGNEVDESELDAGDELAFDNTSSYLSAATSVPTSIPQSQGMQPNGPVALTN